MIDEHEHFWLLDKPAGVSINDEASHAGFISQLQQSVGQKVYPVHRLDKGTTGLLLVAKTEVGNQVLSRAFQEKRIQKHYLAVTRTKPGVKPKKKQGWVKGDMEKSRNGSWKLLHSHSNPAETYFKSVALTERRRLCLLRPISGKTHQIRVAMRALSMPIVGDLRYGGDEADRMYLHSMSLSFSAFGEEFSYTCIPKTGEFFSALNTSLVDELMHDVEAANL